MMHRTHRIAAAIVLAASATCACAADPAPLNSQPSAADPAAATTGLPADANVDQVLDALDQRGKSMREFTAKVSLTSGDPDVGDQSTRIGAMSLQRVDADSARVHIQFDKIKVGRATRDEKSEYVLDGGWLTERDFRKKAETRREVVKPGQKMDLLKLGEGPFPLPIGQDKAEVHKQFDVSMAAAAKDDPPETVHVQLKPLPGTSLAKRFKTIDVWVDRKNSFPSRIVTVGPDGSDEHTTTLSDVTINPPAGLKPEEFKLAPVTADWSQYTEPYRE